MMIASFSSGFWESTVIVVSRRSRPLTPGRSRNLTRKAFRLLSLAHWRALLDSFLTQGARACATLYLTGSAGVGAGAVFSDPCLAGLGLAISKRILKKLNSDIFLESEFGAGSKFYFELELKTVIEEDDYLHSDQINHYNLHKKRILLVEDTLYNIAYATQLLEGWNAEVITAENGAIAVETMLTNNYDLILMDLQMPIMDGYTATSKIREFNSVIPIIALTASASSNVREQVMKAGMQDYVNKPFNPDDFYIKLKKYLN